MNFAARYPRRAMNMLSLPGAMVTLLAAHALDAWLPAQGNATSEMPAVTFHGRVLDVDGTPIEGAAIRAGKPSTPFEVVVAKADARTDADGWFEIAVPADRSWGVSVAAKGKALGSAQADVHQHPRVDVGDVFLLDGAAIRGRVDDGDGQPLAGVRVVPRDRAPNPSDLPGSTETDAKGFFVLRGASPRTASLGFSKDGFAYLALPGVVPASPIRVAMSQGQRVAGCVVDGDGRPIEDAIVNLLREDGGGAYVVRADADGRFEGHVTPGLRYRIRAHAPRGSDEAYSAVFRPPCDDLEIAMPTAATTTAILDLTVLDTEGRPVPRFRAIADWSRHLDSRTDLRQRDAWLGVDGEDGHVLLVSDSSWSPESGQLLVYALGFGEVVCNIPKPAELGGGRTEKTVKLVAERIVRVQVSDEGGQPVAGAQVWAARMPGASGGQSLNGIPRTDREGRFDLDTLGDAVYAIFAHHPAHGMAGVAVETHEPGAHTARIVLPSFEPFDIRFAHEVDADLTGWRLALQGSGVRAEVEHEGERVMRAGGLTVRFGLRPLRGGPLEGVMLPGDLASAALVRVGPFGSVRVEGIVPAPGWRDADGFTIDLAATHTGTLEGEVRITGLPAVSHGVAVVIAREDGWGDPVEVPVTGRRPFSVDLLPGRYRALLIEVATGLELAGPEVVEVAVDREAWCELTAEVGTLRVVPRAAEGWQRHAMRALRLGRDERAPTIDLTDVTESFELLAPAGAFAYRVERRPGELGVHGWGTVDPILAGEIEIVAGKTVELVLEEPPRKSDAELAVER